MYARKRCRGEEKTVTFGRISECKNPAPGEQKKRKRYETAKKEKEEKRGGPPTASRIRSCCTREAVATAQLRPSAILGETGNYTMPTSE